VHVLERHVLLGAVSLDRRAVFGASRAARGWRPRVALRARSSSTCPSSTSVTITAAASK
jgi:hypothetical protein